MRHGTCIHCLNPDDLGLWHESELRALTGNSRENDADPEKKMVLIPYLYIGIAHRKFEELGEYHSVMKSRRRLKKVLTLNIYT